MILTLIILSLLFYPLAAFIRWANLFQSKAAAKRPQFSACLKTWRSLLVVKFVQKKQRFFSGIAFHSLFIRVLSNFVTAPTFGIF
jgi:hypothetical protein